MWKKKWNLLPDSKGVKIKHLWHVAHLSDATRIIDDRVIKPQLVYDESILQSYRLPVVWLSPNRWHKGPMYGTVDFEYDLNFFCSGNLEECCIYWVEAIEKYSPIALRFLLSEKADLETVTNRALIKLSPGTFNQPLYFDETEWRRLNNFTYEIMLDASLPLKGCKRIFFEEHNSDYCNKSAEKSAENCSELSKQESELVVFCKAISESDKLLCKLLSSNSKREIATFFKNQFLEEWYLPELETIRERQWKDWKSSIHASFLSIGAGFPETGKKALLEMADPYLVVRFITNRIRKLFEAGEEEIFKRQAERAISNRFGT
ncbi:MAG: hypothetical protein K2X29_11115 [Candidatus Obscuribacterales bacterium]|nr:hypothetical protein [Candidatus Obscuribacterales bacterium]